MNQMGIIVDSISVKNTIRPPNLSVSMPSGSRMSEPVSTGIATRMPNWVSLSPSVSLIGMPMTANIITFFDELEKIALSQRLLTRAYTKATHAAERFGRQGEKWRGVVTKDPERSSKAFAKAKRFSRIGQKVKSKLVEEPRSLKLRNLERGESKHRGQIWGERTRLKQKSELAAKRKMDAEIERRADEIAAKRGGGLLRMRLIPMN